MAAEATPTDTAASALNASTDAATIATAATTATDSAVTIVTIDDLYKWFGILADADQDAGKHVDTYVKLLSGTKGGVKEKQLACQFITRFFSFFPKEMPLAIDAVFDLVEDEDVVTRKAAIKDLATLAKHASVEHLTRIADILTQLLQTDDPTEFALVQASLLAVFRHNPKATLDEIFNQITTAVLEEVRKRAIKFLVVKIPALLAEHVLGKELEDALVKHVKLVLVDVDAEEFMLLVRLLHSLPSMSTLTGRQDLVNIIMAQSELDKPYANADAERLMILLSCIQQAIPLFSKNVSSSKYVALLLENVLSCALSALSADEAVQFEVLKALAELSVHYSVAPGGCCATVSQMTTLYNLLITYLPKSDEATTATDNRNGGDEEEAKFNFSYVECLLFAFHTLMRHHHAEFLSVDEPACKERLRDLRLRLQYFAKGTQNYIKELRNTLGSSTLANKQDEDNKIRRVALRVTMNIDTLIKDFFHNPPACKSVICLSWKSTDVNKSVETSPAAAASTTSASPRQTVAKRALSAASGNHASSDSSPSSKKKPERGIYQPPSGKYSSSSNGNGSVEAPNSSSSSSSSSSSNNNNNKNKTKNGSNNNSNQSPAGGGIQRRKVDRARYF